MRKLMFVAAAFLLTATLSSFDSSNSNNGNGNIITIENGVAYVWQADNCSADLVPSTSARRQRSSNGFLSIDVTFQLPEGHCDIPERGASVRHYSDNSWAIVNSNGFVKAKVIVNPN